MKIPEILHRFALNWLTLLGSVMAMTAAAAILVVAIVGPGDNPYSASAIVIALPAMFVIGLLLIPIGLFFARRKDPSIPPVPRMIITGRRLAFLVAATAGNVALLAIAGTTAIHHMDSPRFCGTTCHTPMQPEWDTRPDWSHAKVACVACHVGPGASAEAKAKWNGVHQLVGVITGHYAKPIRAPVLPASDRTCEDCHSRTRDIGNQVRFFPHYKDDKDVTPAWTALVAHVGSPAAGIHSHLKPGREIHFQALDDGKKKIGDVSVLENGKVVAQYKPDKGSTAGGRILTMQCLDCHSRPAHTMDGSAREAVDRAIAGGRLDGKIPYVAAIAVDLLGKAHVARDAANGHFRDELDKAFAAHPDVTKPDGAALSRMADVLADLYRRNVFPDMNVGFGTYTSMLGHSGGSDDEDVGCFRCHDGEHTATMPDGSTKSLSKDCDGACHDTLAAEEDPAKLDDTLKALLAHIGQ